MADSEDSIAENEAEDDLYEDLPVFQYDEEFAKVPHFHSVTFIVFIQTSYLRIN